VGAIAPPAETSHRLPDPEIGASLTTKGVSALGPAEFALARPRRMATVLAFASFDRHADGCDSPAKGSYATSKRRAHEDPLRRWLREPMTDATDLWRFLSEGEHHLRTLHVHKGWCSRRSDPPAQGRSASRVRIRDAGQAPPEAPRPAMPRPRCRRRLPIP
jgi:hypothetical protein